MSFGDRKGKKWTTITTREKCSGIAVANHLTTVTERLRALAHSDSSTDMQFKIERVSGMQVSDDELLVDLQATAVNLGKDTVGQKEYRKFGKYDDSTATRRFGTWNGALAAAGLQISNEVGISDERLFENILTLWQHYGRQPRRSELAVLPSTISQSPYNRRFGSWMRSLHAFAEYANSIDELTPPSASAPTQERKAGRDPSLRLRWHVLQRDRFTCHACGKSPASSVGVELHVDHVVPWSKGGETILSNLQTLCSRCNLGKSNVHQR